MRKFTLLDKNKISSLPKMSGVYAFKKGKAFLYIGKAANLRERVKNHFRQPGFKENLFISEVKKIAFIKTNSEIEALISEANLIKKHQPKFNVLWRDDKNYFYIGITQEDFPRVFITHQPTNLKPETYNLKPIYVGPFVDGRALKQTLKILRKVFPYRTCKTLPKRPCLWYELGRCPAPCLLKSSFGSQITGLKKRVKRECQRNIDTLTKILQGKKVQVLRNLKKEMKKSSQSRDFERAAKIRDQIEMFNRVLEHARIFQPLLFPEATWGSIEKHLKKLLGLKKKKIRRIEAYDISNIQGTQATGSMVVFENGAPAKNEYRKFRIKIQERPNDIAMLKEVLSRRFGHLEWPLPDLILIDGGKAQLNAALKIKNQISNIKIIALAKKKNKLYIENKKRPLLLKSLPQGISNLILHLRDEAHRFAIKYHRKLRSIYSLI